MIAFVAQLLRALRNLAPSLDEADALAAGE